MISLRAAVPFQTKVCCESHTTARLAGPFAACVSAQWTPHLYRKLFFCYKMALTTPTRVLGEHLGPPGVLRVSGQGFATTCVTARGSAHTAAATPAG